ncbi:MAG: hypothetical protein IT566_03360 [Rhodospirillaceae bacterium]|nr:hypothetical protein [Rhodospirillaceae bacterium]
MKNILARARFALPLAALALALPAAAQAAQGFTDGRVALRAGPDNDYPRVTTRNRNDPAPNNPRKD